MGDLNFTGERSFSMDYDVNVTGGFGNHVVAITTLHVPANARIGSSTNIAVYEYAGPSSWRRAWISKSKCDMSAARPAYASDSGPHFYLSVGTAQSGMVTVQPGETWYLMVTNQTDIYGSIRDSCSAGHCEIGVTAYPFQ
jgi:hypothetical protein